MINVDELVIIGMYCSVEKIKSIAKVSFRNPIVTKN